MHEMHIIKGLFSDLIKGARENKTKKVTKVYLTMGKFTEIDEDILRHFFGSNAKDTPLENAELSIEKSPTRELRLVSFDCK